MSFIRLASATLALVFSATALGAQSVSPGRPLVVLPDIYNTTDSMALAPDGNVIVAVPNYNNLTLRTYKTHLRESPARLAILDPEKRTIKDWYVFQPKDLNPVTGKAAPMGVSFGPDGNLYFVDRQMPYSKDFQSRIGRVVLRNGKPDHVEYVVEGSYGANDLVWHGDRLYVTDSVAMPPAEKTVNVVSAVYSFTQTELNHGPVRLQRFTRDKQDPHVYLTFISNNKIGAGADGITFDDADNLYVGVIEEGAIYKIHMRADGSHEEPSLFAKDETMLSTDGMIFDRTRRRIYVADFLGNAIHAVTLDGQVSTLQRNGDGDSSKGNLDQPCATLLIGQRLLVSNMDYAGAAPGYAVNTKVHNVHAITSLSLNSR